MRLSLLAGLLTAALLATASPAVAAFQWVEPLPGPLNVDPDDAAFSPHIANVAGTAHVAWSETGDSDHTVRVKRMNSAGTAWEEFAGLVISNGPNQNAGAARIAAVGSVPYVAWEHEGSGYDVRVRHLNGTGDGWEEPTGSLDVGAGDGTSPSIAVQGTTPYVAWTDANTTPFANQVRVKRLVLGVWEEPVAGPLNVDPARFAGIGRIAIVGSTPYVAWQEEDGSGVGQIRVKRLNGAGTAWEEPVAGSLNIDTARYANAPSLAAVGGTAYVAWREQDAGDVDQIRVKRLNATETAWEEVVPGSLNSDTARAARSPSLASVAGVPFVTWAEPNASDIGHVRVKRLSDDGTAWTEPVAGALNLDPAQTGASPTLADIGSVPHVAWHEGSGGATQIRVKRGTEVADPSPGGGPSAGGPGGGGGGPGGGGGGPAAIASAGGLTLSPSAFSAASKGASIAARKPRKTGTTVRYRLSAAARVRFTVEKQTSGRRVGGRCVKQTRANRRRPRCNRFVAATGTFTHTGKAGQNSFKFTGRLNARKLAAAGYRLTATPLAADGRRGTTIRKSFRIIP